MHGNIWNGSESSSVFRLFNSTFQLSVHRPTNVTAESIVSSASVAVTAVSLILNFSALIDLILQRKPKTPFIIYIALLLCSNVVYLVIYGTLTFLTQSFSTWRIGKQACTVHLYNRNIIVPIVLHIHLVIAINRGWALNFPHSYRTVHTFKFAWLVCLAMIVYIHICQLPGLILDAVYYRIPLEKGCWVNTKEQFAWDMFTTFWMYLPKLVTPLSYPFLVWKWVRKRITTYRSAKTTAAAESTVGQSAKGDSQTMSAPPRRKRDRTQPFVMLTFMTLTTFITWTFSFIYYCLVSFNYPVGRLDTLSKMQGAVGQFQALLDPLIFCVASSSLYSYVASIWKRRMRNRKVTFAMQSR